ncbi:hypothetical protein BGY98DRAFT_383484 [Russula aff. rugulosa BPL654]|nr:hypothetical protein BGY98DRAFT_383484 [Russula aff. rugulosa BPL654]
MGYIKHFDGCPKECTLHMALRLATLSMTRTSVADTRRQYAGVRFFESELFGSYDPKYKVFNSEVELIRDPLVTDTDAEKFKGNMVANATSGQGKWGQWLGVRRLAWLCLHRPLLTSDVTELDVFYYNHLLACWLFPM